MKSGSLFLLPLLLIACQRDATTPTAEESERLDEAANLLNEAPANLDAIDDSALNAPGTENRL